MRNVANATKATALTGGYAVVRGKSAPT